MSNQAQILGMGWVQPGSMGSPGAVQKFHSPEEMYHLSGKSVLEVPYKAFGRMDLFSKLGFSAIAFAMSDAGMSPVPAQKENPVPTKYIPLIAESATGCLETDLLYQATVSRQENRLPSPALFAYTLASCFLGEAGIYHRLSGEAYVVEKEPSTGLTALSFAMDALGTDGCEGAVCGICNCGRHLCAGEHPCRPGALFLVIGSCRPAEPKAGEFDVSSLKIVRRADSVDTFYINNTLLNDLTDLIPEDVI